MEWNEFVIIYKKKKKKRIQYCSQYSLHKFSLKLTVTIKINDMSTNSLPTMQVMLMFCECIRPVVNVNYNCDIRFWFSDSEGGNVPQNGQLNLLPAEKDRSSCIGISNYWRKKVKWHSVQSMTRKGMSNIERSG